MRGRAGGRPSPASDGKVGSIDRERALLLFVRIALTAATMMLVVLVLIAVQVITYDPAPQREAVREAHRRGCVREGDQWRCRS